MNTSAITGTSDAGAAPVGHQLQRLPIGCQPTSIVPVVHYVPAEAGTNLYYWTEARTCKQLAQGCYVVAHRPGGEPATFRSRSRRPTIEPPRHATCISSSTVGERTLFVSLLQISVVSTCALTCVASAGVTKYFDPRNKLTP